MHRLFLKVWFELENRCQTSVEKGKIKVVVDFAPQSIFFSPKNRVEMEESQSILKFDIELVARCQVDQQRPGHH